MPYTEIKKSLLYEAIKRFIDILASLILLFVFFPVILLVVLAIRIDSPGPIFADTPGRVGKNGKLFKMYKFRSMIKNAYYIIREHPDYSHLLDIYKEGNYKLKNDPLVTKVGKFIRKHSLDEIPQIVNVIRGEMSLVGPRAYYPDELVEQQMKYPATQEWVKIALSVKPGITGVWQVSGRSEINFDKRIQMDAEYVHKRSTLYDIWIIAKTPWAMISGKGAL